MKLLSNTTMAGTVAVLAMAWGTLPAAAQAGGTWGYIITTNDLNTEVVRNSVDLLGMIRRNNAVGLVNVIEFESHGMAADVETGGMSLVPVSNYMYNIGLQVVASRVTIDWPTGQTIRVVKGTPTATTSGMLSLRAWDETWDGTRLNTTDAAARSAENPTATADFRMQMAFLYPHAAMHAVAFADAKQCMLTGAECDIPLEIDDTGSQVVINATIYGHPYKITLGPDVRPETIESDIMFPDGATHHVVNTYYGYRNGFSLGQEALDRFHAGTFWPSRVTQEVDGTKTLDIIVTAGWSNVFTIYPDPDLLAQQ